MMDAVKFVKTLGRMCDAECIKCEFWKRRSRWESCTSWQKTHPEEAVAIVEKWAKEHPAKTRQSEFLKLFPGVDVDETDGCLTLNPCIIYEKMRKECSGRSCSDCRREFWLAEVEDV